MAVGPANETIVVSSRAATCAGAAVCSDLFVTRYDADGTLDPAFGSQGRGADARRSAEHLRLPARAAGGARRRQGRQGDDRGRDRRRHSGRPARPGRRSRSLLRRHRQGRDGSRRSRNRDRRRSGEGRKRPGHGRRRRGRGKQPAAGPVHGHGPARPGLRPERNLHHPTRSGRQRARRGRRRQGQRLSRHAGLLHHRRPADARRRLRRRREPLTPHRRQPPRVSEGGSRTGDLDRDSGRRRRDLRRRARPPRGPSWPDCCRTASPIRASENGGTRWCPGSSSKARRPPSSTGAAGSSSRVGATTPPTAKAAGRRSSGCTGCCRADAPIEPSAASGPC